MIELKVDVPYEEIERRLGDLKKQSGHVIARAANRTMGTAKKVIKEETAKIYNVTQQQVGAILKVDRATAKAPHVHFVFKDVHQNLAAFGRSSDKDSSLKPRTPVDWSDPFNPDPEYFKAKVFGKGHSAVPLKGRPRPFVQIAKRSKNVILLQRESNHSRAPLRGVAAPALPQILRNEDIVDRFQRETAEMLFKRLNHEIDWVLKGGTK